MADAMTEINDAWNQFNELLESGTQMSIVTKIILSIIGILLILTIGFGIVFVNSDILVPSPPAKITTFIIYSIFELDTNELKHG